MLNNVKQVIVKNLKKEAFEMKTKGCRFVTATCIDLGEEFDVLYHFDKDMELFHLWLRVPKETAIPSISDVYFAAVLVENEIKDGFRIPFEGLPVDYDGKFLIADEAGMAPMRRTSPAVVKKGES